MLVYTSDSRVLLLRRSEPFDFWQSVTGSLEPGETPAAAAIRELSEETGIKDKGELVETGTSRRFTIDPRWRARFPPGVAENIEHEYRLLLERTVKVDLNTKEHSEYRWLPLQEAIDTVWSWTNRAALEALQADLN